MAAPVPSFNNLTPYYKVAAVMQQTARQIQKDFVTAGVGMELNVQAIETFAHLHAQLLPIVSRLMNESFEQLLAVLYRHYTNKHLSQHAMQIVLHPSPNILRCSRATGLLVLHQYRYSN